VNDQPPPQYLPGQYPPDQYPPQEQPARRRGCRGCLIGCLIAAIAGVVLLAVAVVAGVYVVRQMFPTSESVEAAAACVITRVIVAETERGLGDSGLTPTEQEQLRSELERLRGEFQRNCQ
jgi:hypothetical protein